MRVDEIADWCGFDGVWDMILHYLTDDDMLNLLEKFVYADKHGWIQEMIEDWAKRDYDWIDHEKLKADYEDMKYEEWKDSRGEE